MNTTQLVATTIGFFIATVVEMALPTFQSDFLSVTASPNLAQPFIQSGSAISVEQRNEPRFEAEEFTVGLQIGHDHQSILPAELAALEGNTGAQSGDKTEVESNRRIVQETAELLAAEGINVDILPAVVPKRYAADLFLSIHADGSPNTRATGFKNAAPSNDRTGKGSRIVQLLDEEYQRATGFAHDKNNITQNMRHYYAFNYNAFEHAISSATPAALVETGFITNPRDQVLIYDNPQIPARGIANAVIRFLELEQLERSAQMGEPGTQRLESN